WVTTLFSRTAGRVTFDDVDFGFGGVFGGAVRQLAGHPEGFQRRLPARILPGLPRGHPSVGGLLGFADNVACRTGVGFEPVAELFGHRRVDVPTNLGVAELGLRLALELRFSNFDRNDRGQALTDIVTGEVFVLVPQDLL